MLKSALEALFTVSIDPYVIRVVLTIQKKSAGQDTELLTYAMGVQR